MQVKMLGNAGVYVTCNCLVREFIATSMRWTSTSTRNRSRSRRMHEHASLGDFPVGAPITDMQAVYDRHLEARPS